MSKEILSELKTFKEKVSGSTGNMTSSISEAYQSSTSVNQAITKLDNTVTMMNGVKNKIESIITKVTRLEELISLIMDGFKTIHLNKHSQILKLENKLQCLIGVHDNQPQQIIMHRKKMLKTSFFIYTFQTYHIILFHIFLFLLLPF